MPALMSRRTLTAICAVLLWAAATAADNPTFDASRSDARAVAIADQVLAALGGEPAWQATRYLRFDFAVERDGKTAVRRAHTWDKWRGRYRLEGRTRDGDKPFRVVMNLHSKEGSAWLDGRPLAGDELKKQLDSAYAAWVNDTYWLIMPYKMKDPGVILKLDGERQTAEGAWDRVLLAFDGVGLTPRDRYWAFVNRATHLVDRWEYVLKGEDAPPTAWEWRGWRDYGRIQLAPERVNPKDGTRIHFPVLEVPESVPDDLFAP